jgi:hypothetical protein
LPRINLSKIGFASAAVATSAILAIAPVFAQTTPTTPTPDNGSMITIIITAANNASVTYTFTISAEKAAELVAELAAKQAELAKEAAETPEVDEDDTDEVEVENDAHDATTKKTITLTVNGQTKTVQTETEKD